MMGSFQYGVFSGETCLRFVCHIIFSFGRCTFLVAIVVVRSKQHHNNCILEKANAAIEENKRAPDTSQKLGLRTFGGSFDTSFLLPEPEPRQHLARLFAATWSIG